MKLHDSLCLLLSTAFATTVVSGCDSTDDVDMPEVDALEEGADEDTLAQPFLEVEHGDYTLTFLEADDGSVAVVEYAPAKAPALLDDFVRRQATALEILHAVSPEREAPELLVADHERETGGAAPRDVSDFTMQQQPVADGESSSTGYYATNCSFSSDGQSYFDDWWQSLGWGWHWYNYTTPSANIFQTSPNTPKRKKLRAHTCHNGSSGDFYNWGVQRVSSTNCTGGTVYVRFGIEADHRAVYYQTGAADKCRYYTYAINNLDGVTHSLGIMAP